MASQFVSVLSVEQFDGTNTGNMPMDVWINMYGPDTGVPTVEDGVLTISYPGIGGAIPVTVATGQWVSPQGIIYEDADINTNYVPYNP